MAIGSTDQNPFFPWRNGNRFQLLIDGENFYPAMLAAIAGARTHILLEMYLMESGSVADRFITALCAAAARGVAVHVLLDDFGVRGLQRHDRDRLAAAGVTPAYFNPLRRGRLRANLLRNHRKLLLIDSHDAFVGGAGITDDFDPPTHTERRWRETMVCITGPAVLDWQTLFLLTWRRHTGHSLTPLPRIDPLTAGQQRGRVCYSRGLIHPEITHRAIHEIRHAKRRVWFMTAYFVPTIKLRRALRQAAARGIDVRLVLPGPRTDHPAVRHAGRRFYHRLLRHGVQIYEYQPRFNHSKVLLCDDWTSIGSSNIDRWNLRWNLEANQEIDDAFFAAEVAAMFIRDIEQSEPCLLEQWRARPWYHSWRERFWGRVDLWLERHFGGRGKELDD